MCYIVNRKMVVMFTILVPYFVLQPSVSIGNVGQLAIDVLLASTKAEFVTGLFHPAILPVIGSDPLNLKSERLMTGLELFKTEKEAILQLRS